jgi:hypothetical protein
MAGAGRKVFTAGDVLTASQVQDYLQDQSVMVFAGTAARSSAIATPSEGMVSVQIDTDDLTYYNGSSWVSGLSFGAWKSWTPTFSGGWTGAGTHTAKYIQIGKTVIATDYFLLSATPTGSQLLVSLPVTAATSNNVNGFAYCATTTTSGFSQLQVIPQSTTSIQLSAVNSAGTYTSLASTTATAPISFVSGSLFSFTVVYEAA